MDQTNTKTVYRRLFLGTVSIAGLYFLYRVKIIFIPFILAFFIAYLLNPLVHYVENKKVPRGLAILLVYMVVFCVVTSVMVFGVPFIVEEFNRLGNVIPRLTTEIRGIITDIEGSYSRFKLPQGIRDEIDERIKQGEALLTSVIRAAADSLVKLFSYLLGLIIAPFFAFYMLKDAEQIKNSFILTIPRRYRGDVMAVLRDLDEIISSFLRGHVTISLIVGLMTGLGMFLVGVEFAFIIGLIAGIAELVPYLGPFITAVPAVSLALLVSQKTAFYAIIIILIVQQLENAVISPKILGKSLGLHPLVVIFALLAGGEIYGFAGILLAVPAAAALKVILRYVYLKLVDEKGAG